MAQAAARSDRYGPGGPLGVVARILTATAGAYLFSFALARAAAPHVTLPRAEAALLVALLSIFPMLAIAIWAFAARSPWIPLAATAGATGLLWFMASGGGA